MEPYVYLRPSQNQIKSFSSYFRKQHVSTRAHSLFRFENKFPIQLTDRGSFLFRKITCLHTVVWLHSPETEHMGTYPPHMCQTTVVRKLTPSGRPLRGNQRVPTDCYPFRTLSFSSTAASHINRSSRARYFLLSEL